LGHREAILVLARPVAAGQVLVVEDLGEVSVAADSGLGVIPAGERAAQVGRPIAYALPAGVVLTRSVLGAPLVPPAGQAVVALGVKRDRVPDGLAPGTRVAVLVTPSSSASGAAVEPVVRWEATVVGVATSQTDQVAVVGVQLAVEDAQRLAGAAASGVVSVVAVHGGGR
jgi:hypothetical protein